VDLERRPREIDDPVLGHATSRVEARRGLTVDRAVNAKDRFTVSPFIIDREKPPARGGDPMAKGTGMRKEKKKPKKKKK
jgi:hypothetical protein